MKNEPGLSLRRRSKRTRETDGIGTYGQGRDVTGTSINLDGGTSAVL
jgi:hypothetical protein